ncbi:hypothetical protein HRbin36_02884 [bacterium HR36]|nr:hypothetical protein HRbin36_02884 [bacterium HR36]
MRYALGIGVADHVVMEDHAPHPRQHGATRLQRIARTCFRFLRTTGQLVFHRLGVGLKEAAIRPMSMRAQHPREPLPHVGFRFGPIQIPRYIVSRQAFEINFPDGVLVAVNRAVDNRLQRGAFGHRP